MQVFFTRETVALFVLFYKFAKWENVHHWETVDRVEPSLPT
jgi:hypothetical protein